MAQIGEIETHLRALQGTPTVIRISAPNTTAVTTQLSLASRSAEQNARAFQNLLGQITILAGPLGSLANQFNTFINSFQGLGAAELAAIVPTAALTASFIALGAAIAASVAQAVPFEAGLAQLRALTGLSKGDIDELGRGFQTLSTQLPLASTQLIEIGRNAALAGVHGKEELAQFVEIGGQLGVLLRDTDGHAGDLEGTMRELAKFLNAAGVSGEKFIPTLRESASELVTLKVNVGGTVDEILRMSSFLVSIGTKLGLSTSQVLALSSAIASTGGKAQASGHAIARIIEEMQEASIHGGKAADNYARLLGLTADQFKELVLRSPAEAFKRLAGNIDETTKNGTSISQVFADLGIKNIRLQQTIAEAAVAFPKLSTALGIAASASGKQGDLAARAAVATDSFRDKMKKFEDSVQSVAQTLGLQFLPKLSQLVDKARVFTDGIGNLAANGEALKDYAYAGATAVGVLTTAMILNSKWAKAMFEADALAATGGGLKGFLGAIGSGLVNVAGRFSGVTGGFRSLVEVAKLEGAASGVRGFFQVLLSGSVSAAAAIGGIVISLGHLDA